MLGIKEKKENHNTRIIITLKIVFKQTKFISALETSLLECLIASKSGNLHFCYWNSNTMFNK